MKFYQYTEVDFWCLHNLPFPRRKMQDFYTFKKIIRLNLKTTINWITKGNELFSLK